jgi:hypothetical protein
VRVPRAFEDAEEIRAARERMEEELSYLPDDLEWEKFWNPKLCRWEVVILHMFCGRSGTTASIRWALDLIAEFDDDFHIFIFVADSHVELTDKVRLCDGSLVIRGLGDGMAKQHPVELDPCLVYQWRNLLIAYRAIAWLLVVG